MAVRIVVCAGCGRRILTREDDTCPNCGAVARAGTGEAPPAPPVAEPAGARPVAPTVTAAPSVTPRKGRGAGIALVVLALVLGVPAAFGLIGGVLAGEGLHPANRFLALEYQPWDVFADGALIALLFCLALHGLLAVMRRRVGIYALDMALVVLCIFGYGAFAADKLDDKKCQAMQVVGTVLLVFWLVQRFLHARWRRGLAR